MGTKERGNTDCSLGYCQSNSTCTQLTPLMGNLTFLFGDNDFLKLTPDAYTWSNPLLGSYQCIIGVTSSGSDADAQIQLGDSFLRNYDITFDFSGVPATPTSTANADDTAVNAITFALSTYAPIGCALQDNLGEYIEEDSMGLGALCGIMEGCVFAVALIAVAINKFVFNKGEKTEEEEQTGLL